MTPINRRTAIKLTAAGVGALALKPVASFAQATPQPFGAEFPELDSLATGEWWTKSAGAAAAGKGKNKGKGQPPPPPPLMDVPRDQVVAFALYTQQGGVMKMTAQLFPLKPGEPLEARLEVQRDGAWIEIARAKVLYPGWDVHFRVEKWDATKDVPYRVRHGAKAMFDGSIRRDPVDKNEIVVANMSCNSSRTIGQRPEIIDNLKAQNPDLLFFAGDQTYRHTESAGSSLACSSATSCATVRASASRTITMWATATSGARTASGVCAPMAPTGATSTPWTT
ncbi:MAG: hypothetical protein NTX09_00160 [Verrucomicrobia bacterium]|nr:hypothetical protein [Verrucomicrobiota bacterium]